MLENSQASLARLGEVLDGLLHPLDHLLGRGAVLLGTRVADTGKYEAQGQSSPRGPTG